MPDGRYVTLALLKAQQGIGDTIDDTVIQVALDSAEDAIDGHCRRGAAGGPRPFTKVDPDVDSTSVRLYDVGGESISVDDVVDIDQIEIRRTPSGAFEVVDADVWEPLPLNAIADGRPHTRVEFTRPMFGRLRITGWFGWPETPSVVTQATLLQATRWAQRRNAQFGVAPIVGIDSTIGMRLQAKLDADVEVMLKDVRRHTVLV